MVFVKVPIKKYKANKKGNVFKYIVNIPVKVVKQLVDKKNISFEILEDKKK